MDRQGQVGSEITGAAVFQLSSGELSISGNVVSIDSGATSGQFLSFDGDISTTFYSDAGTGIFHWRNPLFSDGEALFCSDAATVIISTFNGSLPNDCSPVTLYVIGGMYRRPLVTAHTLTL